MAPVLVCMDGGVHWQLVGWLCGWKWVGPPGGASSTLDAFRAFPATLLVYALINVGGRMYVPLMWSVVCLETTLTIHLTNFPKENNLSDFRG